MKIDAHNHFIPDELIDFIRKEGQRINTEIIFEEGREYIRHFEGFQYPLLKGFYDLKTKLKDLDAMRLDHAVLSVAPSVFYYWLKPDVALMTSQMCNDWVQKFCAENSERFSGMATIPMQDTKIAIRELERAHEKLSLNAVEIGCVINDDNLCEKKFFDIYEYCESNNILISLHPYHVKVKAQFSSYYNVNLCGYVFDTSMAINSLIFGGVFEKFPNLKVLTVHGGGYFPYQLGRWMHGYKVRPEPKMNISKSPETYLSGLYFDTLTHWNPAMEFLIDNFGAEHVVLGTDYPYDMGNYEPVTNVEKLKLTTEQRQNIYSKNILSLIKRQV